MTTKIEPDVSEIDRLPICSRECPHFWDDCRHAHVFKICRPAVLTLLAEVDAARACDREPTSFDRVAELKQAHAAVDAWRKP